MFWVHASNAARFRQGFEDIAEYLKIPGRQDTNANIYKLVQNWLRNEKNGKWTVVLDNVDDANYLLRPQRLGQASRAGDNDNYPTKPLFHYLPPSRNGSVLITTRSRGAAFKLVESVINVDPMNAEQACALFQSKLGEPSDLADVAELMKLLEYMPLAIVQAAGFIREGGPRCSVSKYMEKFQKNDKSKARLLRRDGERIRTDWEIQEGMNSILVTWHISFKHIYKTRRSAADLLSLMSFFDRQGIPEELLKDRGNTGPRNEPSEAGGKDPLESNGGDGASDCSADDRFEDDIVVLRNYFFISITKDETNAFEMYSLVQLATRKWLKKKRRIERWRRLSIERIFFEFPLNFNEQRRLYRKIFPHARLALSERPKDKESLERWARIAITAGAYAHNMGDSSHAENISIKSCEVYRELFGEEDYNTLLCKELLTAVRIKTGKFSEAEELGEQLYKSHREALGKDHLSTLFSQNQLADIYHMQGRYEKAEKIDQQVVGSLKRLLREDSSLPIRVNDLVASFEQKRIEETKEIEIQGSQTSIWLFAAQVPQILAIIQGLERRCVKEEWLKELAVLGERILQAKKAVLGAEHPFVLQALLSQAFRYQTERRLKEAEELGSQILETARRTLGDEHSQTLMNMFILASTLFQQGRVSEAEVLQNEHLQARIKVSGEEAPESMYGMHSLALTWKAQGRRSEAIDLLKKAVRIQKQFLRADHPERISWDDLLDRWLSEGLTDLKISETAAPDCMEKSATKAEETS